MLAGFSCPSINKISLASLLRTLSWTSKARMDVAFMLHNTRHHLLCKMWKMSDEEPLPFSLLLIFILIFLCLDSCKLQCLEALQFSHIVQSKSFYFLFLHCHHFFLNFQLKKNPDWAFVGRIRSRLSVSVMWCIQSYQDLLTLLFTLSAQILATFRWSL